MAVVDYKTEAQALGEIDRIVHRHNSRRGSVILILQDIQSRFGFVSLPMLLRISELTGVRASELYSIVTFYAQFRLQPIGKNLIHICHGTACHLAGAEKIAEAVRMETGTAEGETSEDGLFTVEPVACLGCCSMAPVMMINGKIYGGMTPDKVKRVLKRYRQPAAAGSGGES